MSPTNPKNISGEEVAKETEFTIKSNNMPSTSTKVPLLFLFCCHNLLLLVCLSLSQTSLLSRIILSYCSSSVPPLTGKQRKKERRKEELGFFWLFVCFFSGVWSGCKALIEPIYTYRKIEELIVFPGGCELGNTKLGQMNWNLGSGTLLFSHIPVGKWHNIYKTSMTFEWMPLKHAH